MLPLAANLMAVDADSSGVTHFVSEAYCLCFWQLRLYQDRQALDLLLIRRQNVKE
jgi:hypothetical protein